MQASISSGKCGFSRVREYGAYREQRYKVEGGVGQYTKLLNKVHKATGMIQGIRELAR